MTLLSHSVQNVVLHSPRSGILMLWLATNFLHTMFWLSVCMARAWVVSIMSGPAALKLSMTYSWRSAFWSRFLEKSHNFLLAWQGLVCLVFVVHSDNCGKQLLEWRQQILNRFVCERSATKLADERHVLDGHGQLWEGYIWSGSTCSSSYAGDSTPHHCLGSAGPACSSKGNFLESGGCSQSSSTMMNFQKMRWTATSAEKNIT